MPLANQVFLSRELLGPQRRGRGNDPSEVSELHHGWRPTFSGACPLWGDKENAVFQEHAVQSAYWPPMNQLRETFIIIIKQITPVSFCLISLLTSTTGQIYSDWLLNLRTSNSPGTKARKWSRGEAHPQRWHPWKEGFALHVLDIYNHRAVIILLPRSLSALKQLFWDREKPQDKSSLSYKNTVSRMELSQGFAQASHTLGWFLPLHCSWPHPHCIGSTLEFLFHRNYPWVILPFF